MDSQVQVHLRHDFTRNEGLRVAHGFLHENPIDEFTEPLRFRIQRRYDVGLGSGAGIGLPANALGRNITKAMEHLGESLRSSLPSSSSGGNHCDSLERCLSQAAYFRRSLSKNVLLSAVTS